jgi:hypothetical protein
MLKTGKVLLSPDVGHAPRQEFSIVLTARQLGGQPTASSESSEVRWSRNPVSQLTVDRSMLIRVNDFLARDESPVIT